MLPDVPTFIEQGIPGMVGSTWASMIARQARRATSSSACPTR